MQRDIYPFKKFTQNIKWINCRWTNLVSTLDYWNLLIISRLTYLESHWMVPYGLYAFPAKKTKKMTHNYFRCAFRCCRQLQHSLSVMSRIVGSRENLSYVLLLTSNNCIGTLEAFSKEYCWWKLIASTARYIVILAISFLPLHCSGTRPHRLM